MSDYKNRLNLNAVYPEASDAAIEGGKRRYYDDKVKNLAVSNDGNFAVITADVEGNFNYKVNIGFEDGELKDYSCSCNAFAQSLGPCKHIVAVALAFQDKYPSAEQKNAATMPSDASVIGLISEFSKARNVRFLGEKGKVRLIPEIMLDNGEAYLRLGVGLKKKYVVRDIKRFVSDFDRREVRRYGAALELYSVFESFEPLSVRFLKLVLSIVAVRGDDCLKSKDTIKLNGEELEKLFEIFSGKLIYLSDARTGSGDRIVEKPDDFTLNLSLDAENGGYRLALRSDINIIYGATEVFILTATNIYPCTESDYLKAEKLIKCFTAKKTLFIAGNDFSAFYNGVLRNIENLNIATELDLAAFEAPPLTASLTIDYVDSKIVGELKTSYGEVEVDIFDENALAAATRDLEAEKGLKAVIRQYFDLPEFQISEEKKIFEFLKYGLARVYNYADILMSEQIRKLRPRRGIRVHPGIKLSGGLLEVKLDGEEYGEEELEKIYRAAVKGKEYVKISGVFIDLKGPEVESLVSLMELGNGNANFNLPMYYAPYLNASFDDACYEDGKRQIERILLKLKNVETSEELPYGLDKIMRPYQKAGFDWLKSLFNMGCGGILADDMGLGKSIQTIALICSPEIRKSLIICPTTLILNWISEFKKFAPEIEVFAVMGNGFERKEQINSFSEGVLITSYELLRRDYALYKDIKFDLAVLDEAQYIKNPETKNALSVKSINADHRFALTGTPIENSLSELWSIFDFIMPGYLGSYSRFRDESEQKILIGDDLAERKLEAMISPFVLRRLKSDVLTELPPKIETEICCPLTDSQRELYLKTLALAKTEFEGEQKGQKVDSLAILSRLRQICCHPGLIDPDYNGNSAKLEAAIQLICDGVKSGRKILVFSQFTTMIDVLRLKLAELGIAGYLLRGDTPKAERLMLVNRFNSDSTPVFFISLLAGGTGLNLTGADMVIHYDPWWNSSVMEQATDRAYRIGQDKPVNVYRLLMEDTVERKIRLLQLKKQKLGQNLIRERDKIEPEKILKMLFEEEL